MKGLQRLPRGGASGDGPRDKASLTTGRRRTRPSRCRCCCSRCSLLLLLLGNWPASRSRCRNQHGPKPRSPPTYGARGGRVSRGWRQPHRRLIARQTELLGGDDARRSIPRPTALLMMILMSAGPSNHVRSSFTAFQHSLATLWAALGGPREKRGQSQSK